MRSENKALAIMLVTFVMLVSVGGVGVYAFMPNGHPPTTVVPRGSFSLGRQILPTVSYVAVFTYSNNETAAYVLTGAWAASAPVQVIVAEELGINHAGCAFTPINVPSGPPVRGCWPAFEGNRSDRLAESFHVCVAPRYLPTGSFDVIFASESPAIVTVLSPIVVARLPFPQSECPSP